MPKITWNHACYICHRPITRGKPMILFTTDRPALVGICHSTCGATKYRYVHFQMCPPDYLSDEQVSFLMHYFYKLFSLPGGEDPNRELRLCLATFLDDYPSSVTSPKVSLQKFMDEHKRWSRKWLYEGDLETDLLRTLGMIQKAASEEPAGMEMDFRKPRGA